MAYSILKPLLSTGVILAAAACGHTPSRLGVRLDDVGVVRSRLGSSRADLPFRDHVSGTAKGFKLADVLGDDRPERLIPLPKGAGLEIRDESNRLLKTVKTPDYLTDMGVVPAPGTKEPLLVLYTYPNKQKGGTFTVLSAASERVASWEELPPPGSFAAGEWRGQPALFYLQGDTIVIRSPAGRRLQELEAPEGSSFRDVFLQTLTNDRMVVVASGSGYTPYHMVCVYSGARLVFQDVETEHAFDVETVPDGSGFVVTARGSRWKYTMR
jgi:hypothetical protein